MSILRFVGFTTLLGAIAHSSAQLTLPRLQQHFQKVLHFPLEIIIIEFAIAECSVGHASNQLNEFNESKPIVTIRRLLVALIHIGDFRVSV